MLFDYLMRSETTRILMINDHIHFGGGGDAAFQLERAIYEKAGYDVHTFSQSSNRTKDLSVFDFVYSESRSRFVQKIGKFSFHPSIYRSLKNLLKAIKPHLVRVHLVSKYPASVYAALTRYTVIQTLHGPNLFCATSWGCLKKNSAECDLGIGFKCYSNGCVPFPIYLLYQFLYWHTSFWVGNSVDLFLAPSRQMCQSAKSIGFAPVEYLPYGIDSKFCDIASKPFDGPPTILFLGAVVAQKGVEILLQAFSLVKKRIAKAKLIIAGLGQLLSQLRRDVSKLNLIEDVDFRGFVDRSQIVKLYNQAHVVAVPSIWKEQFGLVGPEALACGVPCVGSDIGGIPEWLHHGEWGFLFPPRDVEALADKLCVLLQNRELRLTFGKRGREFILKEYGPDKYKHNLLRLVARYTSSI